MNPDQLAAEAAQQAWDKNLIDQNGKTPLKSIIQSGIEKATAAHASEHKGHNAGIPITSTNTLIICRKQTRQHTKRE